MARCWLGFSVLAVSLASVCDFEQIASRATVTCSLRQVSWAAMQPSSASLQDVTHVTITAQYSYITGEASVLARSFGLLPATESLTIDLSHTNVGIEGVRDLVVAIGSLGNLTSMNLILAGNDLSMPDRYGTSALYGYGHGLFAVFGDLPELRDLSLDLTACNLQMSMLRLLAWDVAHLNNIRTLSLALDNNAIQDASALDLGTALGKLTMLRSLLLRMSATGLGDIGAFKLWVSMSHMAHLQNLTVDLSFNKIGIVGASEVGAALGSMLGLEDLVLEMRYNSAGVEGVRNVVTGIVKLPYIHSLHLDARDNEMFNGAACATLTLLEENVQELWHHANWSSISMLGVATTGDGLDAKRHCAQGVSELNLLDPKQASSATPARGRSSTTPFVALESTLKYTQHEKHESTTSSSFMSLESTSSSMQNESTSSSFQNTHSTFWTTRPNMTANALGTTSTPEHDTPGFYNMLTTTVASTQVPTNHTTENHKLRVPRNNTKHTLRKTDRHLPFNNSGFVVLLFAPLIASTIWICSRRKSAQHPHNLRTAVFADEQDEADEGTTTSNSRAVGLVNWSNSRTVAMASPRSPAEGDDSENQPVSARHERAVSLEAMLAAQIDAL